MKPIISGKNTIQPVAFIDTGDIFYLQNQKFRSSDLSSYSKFNVPKVNFGGSGDDFDFVTGGCPGTQFMSRALTFSGTAIWNVNNLSTVGTSLEFSDYRLVAGTNTTAPEILINKETGEESITPGSRYSSDRLARVYMKISDSEYLELLNTSYYNRTHLNYRNRVGDGTIVGIHGTKLYRNYGQSGYIWQTGSDVYTFQSWYHNGFEIHRYNISTQNMSTLLARNIGRDHMTIPSNFFEPVSQDSQKKFYTIRNINKNQLDIYLNTLDISANTCTDQKVATITEIDFDRSDWVIQMVSWIAYDEANDVYNLVFVPTLTGNGNRSNITNNSGHTSVHVFQLDASNPESVTYVTSLNLRSPISGAPIYLNENRTNFILSTDDNVYVLNLANNSINSTSLNLGPARAMLYDTSGRFWVRNNYSETYMLLPNIPVNIVLKAHDTDLVYKGTSLTTSISVEAYNFNGSRISVTGNLKIMSGNAKFSDGSTIKQVSTSATGPVSEDITITGPGLVNVVFDVEV